MGRGKLCLPGYGEPGAARNLCPPEEVLTMRVVVDFELCESNAVCADILPEVFEVRSDNFLYLVNEHPTEDLRDKVMEAVASCPRRAISVVED